MKSLRTELRKVISELLIPEIKVLGFNGPDKIEGNIVLHEFLRNKNETNQRIFIQMEKSGLPRFRLDIEIEPKSGFNNPLIANEVIKSAVVQARNGYSTKNWFRVDLTFFESVIKKSPFNIEKVVNGSISTLPEIENWWQTQAVSTNISDTSFKQTDKNA